MIVTARLRQGSDCRLMLSRHRRGPEKGRGKWRPPSIRRLDLFCKHQKRFGCASGPTRKRDLQEVTLTHVSLELAGASISRQNYIEIFINYDIMIYSEILPICPFTAAELPCTNQSKMRVDGTWRFLSNVGLDMSNAASLWQLLYPLLFDCGRGYVSNHG